MIRSFRTCHCYNFVWIDIVLAMMVYRHHLTH